ncbi:ATP-binding protein [Anaerosacchariphilus sp. NSJ-68]|uniref:ATP-binding protein n=2 Tax=Lachnospiraceae TaxID=186803 RepID=A0A923LBF0_9FIRM|nr:MULTISPECIES: AAA family ATPase [Lachnospiraceae]MBC5659203.1 ATP-binding protein [Anaerosacchariphilus hominis]MBC5696869.1 ATP-binding protein [Roseburia difficilis]
MNTTKTELFQNEQEYYRALTVWVRNLTAAYGEARTKAAGEEGRLLRRNGGLIVSREELLSLLKPEEEAFEAGELLEEFRQIRDRGQKTIREGELIVMEYLFRVLELTEFETYLAVVALACELDHELALAVGYLNEQTGIRVPTLNLCLRMYTGDEAERLRLLQRCLRDWENLGLIFGDLQEVSLGAERAVPDGFQELALKLDYRIVSYLENYEQEDAALGGILQREPEGEQQKPLIQERLTEGLEALYDHGARSFYLRGEPGSGRKLQAGALCRRKRLPILFVDSRKLPLEEEALKRTLRRIMREALLQGGAALCICDLEEDTGEEKVDLGRTEQILEGLRTWKGVLIFTGTAEWNRRIRSGRVIRKVTIPESTTEERILLWKHFLGKELWPEGLNLEYLADKYRLAPGQIRESVQEYEDRLLMEGSIPKEQYLLEACRSQLEHRLGKDAVRIPVHYRWEDLVLPESQKKLLKDACDQVKLHHQIYHRWGFEEKLAYGRGVSMIFYGPPGTGKTMGAQVIAGELAMELYKVDMSGILSKYVGESEKKLGNIFEQARKSQSILFFDEADVLFGKRTDQKDSNDKYANAGTAYLLQKIEEYEGIIILATNFLQNFDNAFLRRFKFIIEFPFTDVPRRKEIWERVFPADTPREELDYEYLAREFQFSGSQIKNVAVAAAFLAAGEGVPVHMRHVLTGVKREMAKTGKTLLAGDFGGYYYLMEEV